MSSIEQIRNQIQKFLNDKNLFTDGLVFVEKKTGVDRTYLFSAALVFFGFYLVVGYATSLIVSLLGFIYPAYASIKAIESANKDDDTQWLTYWVVYGLFTVVEFFGDLILSWFPFYFLFKCIFLVWCMIPLPINGSSLIYKNIIRTYFLKNKAVFDSLAERATHAISKAESELKNTAVKALIDSKDD